MFQVGIDIKRLGVMAIVGQPRSNLNISNPGKGWEEKA